MIAGLLFQARGRRFLHQPAVSSPLHTSRGGATFTGFQGGTSCTGFQGEDKRKFEETYQYTLEQKRAKSEICLSRIRTADMQKMAEKAGLSFSVAELCAEKAAENVEQFRWDDRLEKAQHGG